MTEYIVPVTRSEIVTRRFRVSAPNLDAAIQEALTQAESYNWPRGPMYTNLDPGPVEEAAPAHPGTGCPTFDFTSGGHIDMRVRIVRQGDPYGRNMCLTRESEDPVIEFYQREAKYPDYDFVGLPEDAIAAGAKVLGYQISSYTWKALKEPIYGLCLDGNNRKYDLFPTDVSLVKAWVQKTLDPAAQPAETETHPLESND